LLILRIFSDLRNLKAGEHASLEGPRSQFLDCLFKNRAIRTQKKQKVFYFYSVPHDSLFLEVLERDLKREAANIDATTASYLPMSPRETLEKARALCVTLPGTFPTTDFRTLPTYLNHIHNWSTHSSTLLSPTVPTLNSASPTSYIDSPSIKSASLSDTHSFLNPTNFDKPQQPYSPRPSIHKCAMAGCSRSFQTQNALLKHAKKHLQSRIPMPFSPNPRMLSPLPMHLSTPTLSASPFMFDGNYDFGSMDLFANQNMSALSALSSPGLNLYGTGMTPMMSTMNMNMNLGFGDVNSDGFGVDVYDLGTEKGVFDLQELFKVNAPGDDGMFADLEFGSSLF